MAETAVDNAKYRRLRANGVPHAQAVAMAAVTPTADFSPPSSLATDLELSSALAVKAPLASPAFTGTPTKNGSPVQSAADVAGAYPAAATVAAMVRRSLKEGRGLPFGGRSVWPGTGGTNGLGPTTANNTWANYRALHVSQFDGQDIRLVYANHTQHEATLPTNDITISAGLEYGGTTYPVTFGGGYLKTISPGGIAVSDPVGIRIPKGVQFFTRTHVEVASAGQKWPLGELTRTGSGGALEYWEEGSGTVSDKSKSGTIGSTTGQYQYRPVVVIATPATWQPCVLGVVGDSISTGTGDFSLQPLNYFPDSGLGHLRRANNDAYPMVHLGAGGEKFQTFVNANRAVRGVLLGGVTDLLCEMGVNDFSNSESLATVQTSAVDVWQFCVNKGARVWQSTITPHSTSTDGWGSVGAQTAFSPGEAVRTSWNDWLRDGAPMHLSGSAYVMDATGTTGASVMRCAYYNSAGTLTTAASGPAGHLLAGVFEVADTVESARNSGKWATPDARQVTDAAITSASNVLTSATASFTSADLGKAVAVMGAGTAGAVLVAEINTVTNGTTVVLAGTAGTTVSGAVASIGTPTGDGLHPRTANHIRMAAAIPIAAVAAAAAAASPALF